MVKQIILQIKKKERYDFFFSFPQSVKQYLDADSLLGSMLSVSNALRAPIRRVSACERARTRGEGAGPRGVGAARDGKLVPDIYLTLPGSPDAPRPEIYTADTLREIWAVSEAIQPR